MEYEPIDLYYEEYGQGLPVVLLHGFPFDHTTWLPVARILEQTVRVILPDLRGFGKSPSPEGDYSMRLMAEDVRTLLEKLQIRSSILVGHSMGGYVCLAFARTYPTHLAGLGLVSTRAAADTLENRQHRINQAKRVRRKGVKPVADAMIKTVTNDPGQQQELYDLMMTASKEGVMGALMGMADRPDSTGNLSAIRVPSLVLVGDADAIISTEKAQEMSQLLPRAWLREIPGAGHMTITEKPEEVADAILELVRSCEAFNHEAA